eukprot:TRINITY_DN39258_c0_g1_i1.p1 TRINITY_DN39258_c0_g1~~TRINITY_DN39258_c0_g1_i1.p1  ORF type:complete len:392 (-),score=75.83 TRINITY_DN39258_c0_g1_i1:33-1208(-)
MGLGASKIEKSLGGSFPEGEHFLGLVNYGNTCYCNSVLQALYYILPFRERVHTHYLECVLPLKKEPESLLAQLGYLYYQIRTSKKRTGYVAPRKFITKLRSESDLFASAVHQDAQEFLYFLLTNIEETLHMEIEGILKDQDMPSKEKVRQLKFRSAESNFRRNPSTMLKIPAEKWRTWVREIFEGMLANEVRCLSCERVTTTDASCLDVSVNVKQNTSLMSCLRSFSSVEMMSGKDKFRCEMCSSLQEAQMSIRIKHPPPVIVFHLKRFKFFEQIQRHRKLSYRIACPEKMSIGSSSGCEDVIEQMYELTSVVIHIGSGASYGHYIAMAKSHGHWLIFDDDVVELAQWEDLEGYFGVPIETNGTSETVYLLFYKVMEEHSTPIRHLSVPSH